MEALHTPPEAIMTSNNPRFLFASHFDRLYMFLKSIAAIIHFRALLPPDELNSPYNPSQEAFRPPYTPGSFRLIILIKCLKGHKSLRTLCDGDTDRMEIQKCVTDQATNQHLTWVGASDTCASKKAQLFLHFTWPMYSPDRCSHLKDVFS